MPSPITTKKALGDGIIVFIWIVLIIGLENLLTALLYGTSEPKSFLIFEPKPSLLSKTIHLSLSTALQSLLSLVSCSWRLGWRGSR